MQFGACKMYDRYLDRYVHCANVLSNGNLSMPGEHNKYYKETNYSSGSYQQDLCRK